MYNGHTALRWGNFPISSEEESLHDCYVCIYSYICLANLIYNNNMKKFFLLFAMLMCVSIGHAQAPIMLNYFMMMWLGI